MLILIAAATLALSAPSPAIPCSVAPPGTPAQEAERWRRAVKVYIHRDGGLVVRGPMTGPDGWTTTPEHLATDLARAGGPQFSGADAILVLADPEAPYGALFEVVERLKLAGFLKVKVIGLLDPS